MLFVSYRVVESVLRSKDFSFKTRLPRLNLSKQNVGNQITSLLSDNVLRKTVFTMFQLPIYKLFLFRHTEFEPDFN